MTRYQSLTRPAIYFFTESNFLFLFCENLAIINHILILEPVCHKVRTCFPFRHSSAHSYPAASVMTFDRKRRPIESAELNSCLTIVWSQQPKEALNGVFKLFHSFPDFILFFSDFVSWNHWRSAA